MVLFPIIVIFLSPEENSGLLEENQKNNDLLKNELNQKITELKDKIKNLEEQKDIQKN